MAMALDPKYYFSNREDATEQLLKTLPLELMREQEMLIIGVSKESVYVADKIAKAIGGEMDILLSEPIVAPHNSEVAIAMVSETEEVLINRRLKEAFGLADDFIYSEAQRKYDEEILHYIYRYRKGKKITPVSKKSVVLVDITIETGLTMMSALKSVITKEAKSVYIATPIIDKIVYEKLLTICDGVFTPHVIQDYISIEYYYESFQEADVEEVLEIMQAYETTAKTDINHIKKDTNA